MRYWDGGARGDVGAARADVTVAERPAAPCGRLRLWTGVGQSAAYAAETSVDASRDPPAGRAGDRGRGRPISAGRPGRHPLRPHPRGQRRPPGEARIARHRRARRDRARPGRVPDRLCPQRPGHPDRGGADHRPPRGDPPDRHRLRRAPSVPDRVGTAPTRPTARGRARGGAAHVLPARRSLRGGRGGGRGAVPIDRGRPPGGRLLRRLRGRPVGAQRPVPVVDRRCPPGGSGAGPVRPRLLPPRRGLRGPRSPSSAGSPPMWPRPSTTPWPSWSRSGTSTTHGWWQA